MKKSPFKSILNNVLVLQEEVPNSPIFLESKKFILDLNEKLGVNKMEDLYNAMQFDASGLIDLNDIRLTKRQLRKILKTEMDITSFLNSNYFEGALSSYQNRFKNNLFFEGITYQKETGEIEPARRKPCIINGVEEPRWKCWVAIAVVVVIIIIML